MAESTEREETLISNRNTIQASDEKYKVEIYGCGHQSRQVINIGSHAMRKVQPRVGNLMGDSTARCYLKEKKEIDRRTVTSKFGDVQASVEAIPVWKNKGYAKA